MRGTCTNKACESLLLSTRRIHPSTLARASRQLSIHWYGLELQASKYSLNFKLNRQVISTIHFCTCKYCVWHRTKSLKKFHEFFSDVQKNQIRPRSSIAVDREKLLQTMERPNIREQFNENTIIVRKSAYFKKLRIWWKFESCEQNFKERVSVIAENNC